MKYFLIAHTAFCILLGIVYLLFPFTIIHHLKEDSFEISRLLGFAVATPGFLSLVMTRAFHNREMIMYGLFVMALFQTGMMLSSALASARGSMLVFIPFAHGIFALFMILLIFRHAKGNTQIR